MRRRITSALFLSGFISLLISTTAFCASSKLGSWNEPYQTELVSFVRDISNRSSPNYLPPEERIAVFDMDGTLIEERPNYFEVELALHHLKRELLQGGRSASNAPLKAVKNGDKKYIVAHGKELMAEYLKGRTWGDVVAEAGDFYENGTNDKFGCRHRQLAFGPMVELVSYLQKNNFQIYIVSTSVLPVTREIAKRSFNLDPYHVIGAAPSLKLSKRGDMDGAVFTGNYLEPYTADDGKSVRIIEEIGVSPIFVAGNSSGDRAMMILADESSKHRNAKILLVDHDDPREEVYRKDDMLAIAKDRGWTVLPISKAFRGEIFIDCPTH